LLNIKMQWFTFLHIKVVPVLQFYITSDYLYILMLAYFHGHITAWRF
jgi:hypothetical protein